MGVDRAREIFEENECFAEIREKIYEEFPEDSAEVESWIDEVGAHHDDIIYEFEENLNEPWEG